jgi:hypothetical protein
MAVSAGRVRAQFREARIKSKKNKKTKRWHPARLIHQHHSQNMFYPELRIISAALSRSWDGVRRGCLWRRGRYRQNFKVFEKVPIYCLRNCN